MAYVGQRRQRDRDLLYNLPLVVRKSNYLGRSGKQNMGNRDEDEMRRLSNMGQCRTCGARIMWIRTKAGKNMPVDPELVDYRKAAGGKERIVTPEGDVVAGERCKAEGQPDGHGYISHFATCPNFRRRTG